MPLKAGYLVKKCHICTLLKVKITAKIHQLFSRNKTFILFYVFAAYLSKH